MDKLSLLFSTLLSQKQGIYDLEMTAFLIHLWPYDSLTSFKTIQLCFILMTCMHQAFSSCGISLKLWSAMRGQALKISLANKGHQILHSTDSICMKNQHCTSLRLASKNTVNHTGKRIHAYGKRIMHPQKYLKQKTRVPQICIRFCLIESSSFLAGAIYIWLLNGLHCVVSTKPTVLWECAGKYNFSTGNKKVWWAFPTPQPFPNIRLYAMLTNTWRVKSQWLSSPFSTSEEAEYKSTGCFYLCTEVYLT